MSSFVARWKKEARIILVLGNYQSNVCVGFVWCYSWETWTNFYSPSIGIKWQNKVWVPPKSCLVNEWTWWALLRGAGTPQAHGWQRGKTGALVLAEWLAGSLAVEHLSSRHLGWSATPRLLGLVSVSTAAFTDWLFNLKGWRDLVHLVHFRDFPRFLNYLFPNLNESRQKISNLAKMPLEIAGS